MFFSVGCQRQPPNPGTQQPGKPSQQLTLGERCERAAILLGSELRSQPESGLGEAPEILVRPPYIIAGSSSQRELASLYENSILPATIALQRQFFSKAVNRPTTVLLFPDQSTYRKFAKVRHPSSIRAKSVYGYYEPTDQTIFVNLAAGEGTIVHELIHAMIDSDFPDAPHWFNEGLASLFEHSRLSGMPDLPQLTPLHNWRLTVLQRGIADGQLQPIRNLVAATNEHGENEALFYSHARYFCFYLYELGHLEEFYAGYRNNNESPQLLLAKVAPELDGDDWEKNFRKWTTQQRLPKTDNNETAGAIHRLINNGQIK